ncbi:hypothetical protein CHRYSEOSP005_31590 [Chryseobacterium sp. Alg-005]|uniref:helix-turn-helix domain-containing protein n=1 Tax=Chryseobacterium sp. Alg-005 TaxID=3159516 RepID=UPI0035556D60
MKKYFYGFFILILLINFGFAQKTPENLIRDYIVTGKEANNGNFAEAEKKYLQLIKICEKNKYYNLASLSYNGIGHIYLEKGNFEKARTFFENGIRIGQQSVEKSGMALNLGCIGLLHQELGFNVQDENYIANGISLMENNTQSDVFHNLVLGNLYMMASFSKINNPDNLKIRLSYAKKVLEFHKKMPEKYFDKKQYYSHAFSNIASIETELKLYDAAILNFKNAEKYNTKHLKIVSSYIYLGLATNYAKKKEYDSVIFYGNKVLEYTDEDHQKLKDLDVYSLLIDAYKKNNQPELAKKFADKYKVIDSELNKSKLKSAAQIYKKNKEKANELNGQIKIIIIVFAFLIIFCLGFIFYFRRKHKKEMQAYINYRNELVPSTEGKTTASTNDETLTDNKTKNSISKLQEAISNETESQILQGLEKFEIRLQFLQRGITQGKLASQLNTNARYLSIIIKKHKADNFSLYINSLRINYITEKIENNEEYRKYKISYLAEECGYPTLASFTKVFNEMTGVAPSTYIRILNNEIKNISADSNN